MTFNDVMAVILRYFTDFGSFRAHYAKVLKIHLHFLRKNVARRI